MPIVFASMSKNGEDYQSVKFQKVAAFNGTRPRSVGIPYNQYYLNYV